MKKIFIKIIIWLFNRYAFDNWVDEQEKQNLQEFQEKHNLKDGEIEEALIDKQQEPLREAYEAGIRDGYEKALEKRRQLTP